MINKKVFALTLVASSVIAAGCSSDDDDDDTVAGNTCDSIETDAQSIDVDGDGTIGNSGDDLDNNCFVNEQDVDIFAEQELEELEDQTTDLVTPDDDSTDVDGDGFLTDADDLDGDGDIDDDDVTLAGGTDTGTGTIGENSITALVRGTDDFSTLSTAIDAAGLAETLGDDNATFTVFAPNNDAFQAFQADPDNAAALDAFLANPDDGNLANVLTYHVLPTRETVDSLRELITDDGTEDDGNDLNDTAEVTTVQGDTLTLGVVDNDNDPETEGDLALTVNGIVVVDEIDGATNGNILVIQDGLLIPTTPPAMTDPDPVDPNAPTENTGAVEGAVAASGSYSEFLQIFRDTLGGPALDDPNNTWTVIAPTNDAIEDPSDIDIQDYVVVGTKFDPDAFSGDIGTNGGGSFNVTGSGSGGDLQIDGNDAAVIAESDTLIVYGIDGTLGD